MQPADPFPASDFDEWAESYDRDVLTPDTFPFDAYERVLETTVAWAEARAGMSVLDIGIGTGNLAARFAKLGCQVWGLDYSPAMLDKARRKLPAATLVLHDLRKEWPAELDRRFDRIVSAYAFHHFELEHKVKIVSCLARNNLAAGGIAVIADVSFPSGGAMQEFKQAAGEHWEDEPYWHADEAQAALKQAGMTAAYKQVSPSAGVYRIEIS